MVENNKLFGYNKSLIMLNKWSTLNFEYVLIFSEVQCYWKSFFNKIICFMLDKIIFEIFLIE